MRKSWLVVGLYLLFMFWGLARADEGPAIHDERAAGAQVTNPHHAAIKKAADAKDYEGVIQAAQRGLASDSSNADFHNMFAFGHRNKPNPDMALVFKHYNEALRLDPWHAGAHEYLGEAYVMVGNIAKAKEHLERVRLSCQGRCAEYQKLEKAIQAASAKSTK